MTRRRLTRLPIAGQPALELVELDGILFTGAVHGADSASGELTDRNEEQLDRAFDNLERLMREAGASAGNIGLVTVSVGSTDDARLIEKRWRRVFGDSGGPTRKVNVYRLPPGVRVQLQAVGVVGKSPEPLRAPGFEIGRVPAAVQIGELVLTTGVDGRDPETGHLSTDREEQVRRAYANLRALLSEAGASWDDVLHVYAFLDRLKAQSLMHEVWEGIFTNHGQCPARKAIHYSAFDNDSTILELQAVAALGGGSRRDLVLQNVPLHETGTMGAVIGGHLRSCGISGNPNGKLGTVDEQMDWIFPHTRALMQKAGGSLDDIGQVTILVRDYAEAPRIAQAWRQAFPDPDDEPAHTFAAFGLNPSNAELAQFQIAGALSGPIQKISER